MGSVVGTSGLLSSMKAILHARSPTRTAQLPTAASASSPSPQASSRASGFVLGRKTGIETDPLSQKVAIAFCFSEFMLFCSFELSTPRVRAAAPRRSLTDDRRLPRRPLLHRPASRGGETRISAVAHSGDGAGGLVLCGDRARRGDLARAGARSSPRPSRRARARPRQDRDHRPAPGAPRRHPAGRV